MISKHGSVWDDGTPQTRLAEARKFVEEKCIEKRCPRNAFCVHEVQCPGTLRRS